MSTAIVRPSLAAALTIVVATGAFAQEAKRGEGRAKRDGTVQTATTGKQGSGSARATTQQVKNESGRGTVADVAVAPAPVVVAVPAPTTSYGWWGRGGANATPGIDRTQSQQAAEIEAGRRRGLITEQEARALKAEQDRIAEMERRAKSDGHVTQDERAQIRKAQKSAERHIVEETFDSDRQGGRRRYLGGWWGGRGWW